MIAPVRGRGIELILMRQLASCLAAPIVLCDPRGDLIYVNEPAEELLGLRVGESDTVSVHELADRLCVRDDTGERLSWDQLPNRLAASSGRAVQRRLLIRGSDGRERRLDATAFPLVSPVGENVGTVSIFWESTDEG